VRGAIAALPERTTEDPPGLVYRASLYGEELLVNWPHPAELEVAIRTLIDQEST
jgi:hypothetical protein